MTDELLSAMRIDIKRCEDAQQEKKGSYKLFQSLISRYKTIYPTFDNDIPKSGKVTFDGEFDYRNELNAIKEKLEFIVLSESSSDPFYSFKKMLDEDIVHLKKYNDNFSSFEEKELLDFYAQITAKYHPYIPKLGEGLYGFIRDYGVYENVGNTSLKYNLNQLYNFMGFDTEGIRQIITICQLDSHKYQLDAMTPNVLTYNINKDHFEEHKDKLEQFYNQTSMSEQEIIENISLQFPNFKTLDALWNSTRTFKAMSLTSVGLAIAILNYNIKTGEKILLKNYLS